MPTYTIEITEDEAKAVLTDVADIDIWLQNAVQNKIRQTVTAICREALDDESDTILAASEKQEVLDKIAAAGIIVTTVDKLPHKAKMLIVRKARVKSALERGAELEEPEEIVP